MSRGGLSKGYGLGRPMSEDVDLKGDADRGLLTSALGPHRGKLRDAGLRRRLDAISRSVHQLARQLAFLSFRLELRAKPFVFAAGYAAVHGYD